jgi:hypothetical protein
MKEKPLDHKKGTACDPEQSGPDAELCTPLVRELEQQGRGAMRVKAAVAVTTQWLWPWPWLAGTGAGSWGGGLAVRPIALN